MKTGKPAPENTDTNLRPCAPGYALLILMMMVTLLLVGMTVALPSIYTEAQREKEEELMFRGSQYARAIAAFHQKFNRYPSSVKELLKKTNGVRFLRQAYTDPMTKNGKWRFIHSDATGILVDSLTQQTSAVPGMGAGGGMGGLPGANFGAGRGTGAGLGAGATSMGAGSKSSDSEDQEDADKKKEEEKKKLEEQIRKACDPANAESDDSSSSGNSQLGGGRYIAGVASCSLKESIRVLNGKTHYDEWEFLGIILPGTPGQPGAQPGAQPGTQPGSQQGVGGSAGSSNTGGTGGSTTQPTAPSQAGPQAPQVPPLTDQPDQPGESDQSSPPEPDEPQR
jgi:type II secretory pathway pseudopilin PulG